MEALGKNLKVTETEKYAGFFPQTTACKIIVQLVERIRILHDL